MTRSLRWKILAWALLNLLLVAGAVVWFLRAQFQVGIESLLAGATGMRLDAIARQLLPQLRARPESAWPAALDEAVGDWRARGVRAALVHNSGDVVTGDIATVPAEVRAAFSRHDARMGGPGAGEPPPPPPGEERGPFPEPPDDGFDEPGPRPPPPPDGMFGPGPPPARTPAGQPGTATRTATPSPGFEKFMVVSNNPRRYWAGVHLDSSSGPFPFTLLFSADSLRGGGLFFDYGPWLLLAAVLVLVSVLLWLPFVRTLTGALTRLTASAERIAEGRFEPPPGTRRGDELGRLQAAHRNMALRLDGFVTGQKRFLGDTAHELLSPLARLEVALSILEERAGERERPAVERALGEAHHIAALVQQLLAFTKTGLAGKPAALEPVELAPLVRRTVGREAGEARVDLRLGDGLRVSAAPELLERALANVVRNAVRHAAAGGPIEVAAKAAGDRVVLTVRDAGPGVPGDALPRLFDPFFRPDPARAPATGGAGLGLAIVKGCVEACGGAVTARNLSPRGFAVTIELAAG